MSTYIGIAFYASNGLPTQWVIVLSSDRLFHRDSWCGTFIASINGQVESWTRCETSIAYFAPHLFFLGALMVGEVTYPVAGVKQSISNLASVQELRRSSCDGYPPSDEYVRRAILHLDQQKIIRLPPSVKSNFSNHIKECLTRLQGIQKSDVLSAFVIPIV